MSSTNELPAGGIIAGSSVAAHEAVVAATAAAGGGVGVDVAVHPAAAAIHGVRSLARTTTPPRAPPLCLFVGSASSEFMISKLAKPVDRCSDPSF